MKPCFAVLVVALAAPCSVALHLGCSHDARPVAEPVAQPDDHPPLPPAAGTPIGHLVDAAAELKLSDDQLGKLRAINDDLAGKLSVDDSEMVPEPVTPPPDQNKPRGLMFNGGGQTSSGTASRPGSLPETGAKAGNGNGDVTTSYIIPSSTVTHVYRQRARHIREAIHRALPLLDPGQQVIARRVLVDHGVNPDTGEFGIAEPGATKLEDPKLGKPLPRESEP